MPAVGQSRREIAADGACPVYANPHAPLSAPAVGLLKAGGSKTWPTREYRGLIHRNNADLAAWLAKRPAEKALEPDLPIIDPHHHLVGHRTQRGRYFLPELLADTGGGHNIVSTVFLECQAMFRASGPEEMKPVGEVEFVNGTAAHERLGPVRQDARLRGDHRLGRPDAGRPRARGAGGRDRRRPAAASAACATARRGTKARRGKYRLAAMPPHRLLDPKFREGFAELGKLGLTFDSWHFHPQLPDLVDLARAFPGQTIIVDHVGGHLGVGQYAGKQAEIDAGLEEEHRRSSPSAPTSTSKLGGLGMTSFGFDFHFRDAPPSSQELAAGVAALHRDLHRGCSAPTAACSRATSRPTSSRAATPSCGTPSSIITKGASAAEKTALYSGTAARVYSDDQALAIMLLPLRGAREGEERDLLVQPDILEARAVVDAVAVQHQRP